MIRKSLLASVLACASFAAHAAETVYTFDSVTRVEQRGSLLITGVLVNETTPTTVTVPLSSGLLTESCLDLVNTVLARPEGYTLSVVTEYVPPTGGMIPVPGYTKLNGCSVDVKP